MALLLHKKHILNSNGEEELLNIYTTKEEACDTGKPCRIVNIKLDNQDIIGYIGYTDELDTPKISSKRILVDDKEYSERKYMGVKSMKYYMKNTYPDTYSTMEYLPNEFPDTSDAIDQYDMCAHCQNLKTLGKPIYVGRLKTLAGSFYNCVSIEEIELRHTHNITSYRLAFYNNKSLKKIQISLKKATVENYNTVLEGAFQYLNTECLIILDDVDTNINEQMVRSASKAPSECNIIMNYRSE